jgi:hypothetical protein
VSLIRRASQWRASGDSAPEQVADAERSRSFTDHLLSPDDGLVRCPEDFSRLLKLLWHVVLALVVVFAGVALVVVLALVALDWLLGLEPHAVAEDLLGFVTSTAGVVFLAVASAIAVLRRIRVRRRRES